MLVVYILVRSTEKEVATVVEWLRRGLNRRRLNLASLQTITSTNDILSVSVCAHL